MPTAWERDLAAAHERFLPWLRARVGGASDLELSELSAPQASGFSNETLLCEATWSEAGRRRHESLVVRVQPTGFQVFPEYDLKLQFDTMARLAPTPVPVPRVLWLEAEERDVFGAPFYVMARVDGRVPTDNPPYHVGGWMTEATPAEREAIWYGGIDAMAEIHGLDWRALGFEDLRDPAHAPGLDQQFAYYQRYLEWSARGRPQPTLEAAWEWLAKHRPEDEAIGLCWGDARIGNILFDGTRVAAVLDWEMVTLGDGEADLAWAIFLDRHHSEGLEAPRLEGFPSYADSVARWEQRVGREARHLEFYERWAGFRFGVIMGRIAQQMQHYGVLPADSDYETNNTVTRLLAKLLELPPPGEAGA